MDLTKAITGRTVFLNDHLGYYQDDDLITVPNNMSDKDTFDEVLHELGHWVVASDKERMWPNLALDGYAKDINNALPKEEQIGHINADLRENQAVCLTKLIYDLAGVDMKQSHSARVLDYYGEDDGPAVRRAQSRAKALSPTLIQDVAKLLEELYN